MKSRTESFVVDLLLFLAAVFLVIYGAHEAACEAIPEACRDAR